MITANEIREKFLKFFEDKGHEIVSSSSLIPADDPTLLFTNAGMVQFKKTFLGQEKRAYVRATTSQKCLRVGGKHNDLENVGRTARHHTFFEMLGNFSFGDYFKKDAIRYAWEFITEELKLPKEKLYITIYSDDDEAKELWMSEAGVPEDKIFRLGEKDNFWSMGDTGPCGPCTEIHVDQGEHMTCGPDCGIGKCDCDRFLEIWNLVFMQFNQDEQGIRTPLPNPNIDTGMGLERIAAVCQGVYSNYDTDLFLEFINFTAALAGVTYKKDGEDVDTALRVIADHSRAIAFMISDGILPSNEGRGYVLRRLIRRAYRFGRLMGLSGCYIHKSVAKVVEVMGKQYPELCENAEFMDRVVIMEEEGFNKTLDKGLALLEDEILAVENTSAKTLKGETVFKLYDTYGFPIDIINDIAEKRGIAVDEDGFNAFMTQQKQRAKAAWKGAAGDTLAARFQSLLEEGVRSEFVGYSNLGVESRVAVLMNEEAENVDSLTAGQKGYLVSSKTPFYGESGGQTGDHGVISADSGQAAVIDTLKPNAELTVHHIEVSEGTIRNEQAVTLQVSEELRLASARNHTCTHLLHAALRRVLGDHVKQSGSLVTPDRLRFDFTHISALTPEEIKAIELDVNTAIMANIPLDVAEMEYDKAVEKGAMALFGEKYEDKVRVVAIGDNSVELCGGTHLSATGQAGSFFILSDGGVAAGIRRIEATTGFNALNLSFANREELQEIAGLVKGKPGDVANRVKGLQQENRTLRKDMEKLAAKAASSQGGDLMSNVTDVNGTKVLAARVDVPNVKALRDIMDDIRSKLGSGIACLASADSEGKVTLLVAVTKDLNDNFKAGQLIGQIAGEVGGKGGGRPDMAQAGGNNADGINAAFDKLKELVKG
ncbi:alanine--tRNA ligase [Halodesulfovibrio spirochaetisodalis]|uniref:Alanine--tRNA ligase n=1 Tax=Halodesulfovibrio spirochaetisodalis TaxID=1560234 RepID=A0A1B7XFI4_9BACT|nr:alanine--tRNA ligase [Halodesulfovibrio spirochaetisodalis]OBQ54056.1 alanyl-tRNA synthetase [Halodesulfovibrio spirochaetisodalis]